MSQWDFPFVVMIFSLLWSRISILFRKNSNLDGFLCVFRILSMLRPSLPGFVGFFSGEIFFTDFLLVVSLKCGRWGVWPVFDLYIWKLIQLRSLQRTLYSWWLRGTEVVLKLQMLCCIISAEVQVERFRVWSGVGGEPGLDSFRGGDDLCRRHQGCGRGLALLLEIYREEVKVGRTVQGRDK